MLLERDNRHPTIVPWKATKLVGLKAPLRRNNGLGPDVATIARLWRELTLLAAELSQRIGQERYALITDDITHNTKSEPFYYALVAVSDFSNLPSSWIELQLPQARLAKFRHCGPPSSLRKTSEYACFHWLPTSGESLLANQELCIYPPGYNRDDPNACFEYGLFLQALQT